MKPSKTITICIAIVVCVLAAKSPEILQFIIDRFGVALFVTALIVWLDNDNSKPKI